MDVWYSPQARRVVKVNYVIFNHGGEIGGNWENALVESEFAKRNRGRRLRRERDMRPNQAVNTDVRRRGFARAAVAGYLLRYASPWTLPDLDTR